MHFLHPSISLNGSWQLLYDGDETQSISTLNFELPSRSIIVPSVINVHEHGAGYRGIMWFRKQIQVPNHQGLFALRMEGWYGAAQFYVNKVQVGERLHGYTPYSCFFQLDPSLDNGNHKNLRTQDIEVVVRIDNREQEGQTFKSADFRQWAGIHRTIMLDLIPSTWIEQIFFSSNINHQTIVGSPKSSTYNADSELCAFALLFSIEEEISAEISVQMTRKSGSHPQTIQFEKEEIEFANHHFINYFKAKSSINVETGKLKPLNVKLMSFKATENCDLWHIDQPNLYQLSAQLNSAYSSGIIENVGIRSITTNKQGQLLLNNKPIRFLGANRHDEHPEFGPTFVPQLIEHDLAIMKQSFFTGYRPAHYPTTNFQLDVSDQLGLMVIEEIPNYIMMPHHFIDEKVLTRGHEMFREMILAHYNHPSVIMWSMANECKSHLPESKSMLNKLANIGAELDPTRLLHFTGYPGIQNIAEIAESIPHVAAVNVYYGDSVSGRRFEPETIGTVLDNLREFMEDEDMEMAEIPLMISEFGSQTVYGYHDIHPYHGKDGDSTPYTIYTEERQAYVFEKFAEVVKSRPYVAGMMIWCWRDNRYEPEIAESSAGKIMRYGLLDWTGAPKLGFHILKRLFKQLQEDIE